MVDDVLLNKAAIISIGRLIVVSLLTPPPKAEELAPLFKA